MSICKLLCVTILLIWSTLILAEPFGTAFTYQGRLQHQGSAAHGEFDFVFALFDSELAVVEITSPVELENVVVTEGRFTVELDFGMVIQAADEFWLEIGVRPGSSLENHTLLSPRQYLYPSPRSVFALRAATSDHSSHASDSDKLQGHPASDFALSENVGLNWSLNGNAGTVPGQFLGTLDNQALEVRVDNNRALRLEPGSTSPNIVGGYAGNSAAGATGAAIAGGGRDLAINHVTGDFGAVGGGAGNAVGGYAATVGGGEQHSAAGAYAVIGGGQQNTAGERAVVGGGRNNQAGGSYAIVSGGNANDASAAFASVGGGASNKVTGNFAVVGGGSYNDAQANYATILGGGPFDEGNPTTTNNRVSDEYGAIGGGGGNSAGDGDGDASSAPFATVSGGRQNTAGGGYSAVAGGNSNTAIGYAAVIAGGASNSANSNFATVSGGSGNSVGNQYATVSGGRNNTAANTYATVSGGYENNATGAFATVPGGVQNAASGNYSLAAGQGASAAHAGSFVWSDSNTDSFSSTADDQFLVRAGGGVGIGTDSPSGALKVVGDTYLQGNAWILGEDDLVSLGNTDGLAPGCNTADPPSVVSCLNRVPAISVVGNTVFMVSESTNTLTAFDVTDPQNIQVIGISTNELQGPRSVVASGRHVYVASRHNSRLVVFEMSHSSQQFFYNIGSVNLPGEPEDVFVSGTYAYLVGSGESPFFAVVDVYDPSNPVVRSFVPTGGRSVHVSGTWAYVAAPTGLNVYNVSDPENVVIAGSTSEMTSSPSSIYVSGNRAYVTMETSNSLVVYDISSPAVFTELGSSPTGSLVRPVSVMVSGDHAYVACTGEFVTAENNGIMIFDVSDPASILVRGTTTEEAQRARAVSVAGERVFVTSECFGENCGDGGSDNRFVIYGFNHLKSPALQVGNLQAGYLDVVDSASVANGLNVGGGLNAGQAFVGGDLGIGGDLRMLGSIGGEDDIVCTQTGIPDGCDSWAPLPRLTFTNDIYLGGHWIQGADYPPHCTEGKYLADLECCGFTVQGSDYTECLADVIPVWFPPDDQRVAVDGHLVPACNANAEGCQNWDLGHPSLRWNDIWAANGVIQTSDGRLKGDVTPLPYGVADLARLEPVSFTWKDGDPDVRHLGLIAQEVREVLPELVHRGGDNSDILGLNYGELVPVLINAIKELQDELADQTFMIQALQKRLDLLEQSE